MLARSEAGGDGAHGAVDRAQQVVGQFIGNAEEGMARRQVEEVAVGAGEVGPVAGGGILAVGAPVGRSAQAHMAVVAGEHGGVHHTVAFLHVGSPVVGGDSVAQVFDDAGSFVSHDATGIRQGVVLLGLVAAPGVQIGSADAGLGHAEQHGPRFGFGHVVFLDLKGLAVFLDDNDASFHGVPSDGACALMGGILAYGPPIGKGGSCRAEGSRARVIHCRPSARNRHIECRGRDYEDCYRLRPRRV